MSGGIPFTVDTWTPISKKKMHLVLTHALKDRSQGIAAFPIYSTKPLVLQHCPQLDDLLYASIEDISGSILIEVGGHTYQLVCYTPPGISRLATNLAPPDTLVTKKNLYLAAAKKRARNHLTETDEFLMGNNDAVLMDLVTNSTAYKKMISLCLNFSNEIFTDMEIHNQHVLPSFIDLPNLSSAIYSVELSTRLRRVLIVCPPTGPTPHVTELIIATANLHNDICAWNINPIKGGVDAKELFNFYITHWIHDKRLSLLVSCKQDKLGVLLNSLKRIVDGLQPKIENKFKSWGAASAECLSDVTIMVRTKFKNYIQVVVEKLAENTKLQNSTKLKKILGDSKESISESDVENRMQPLKEQLTYMINHLHGIFLTWVFYFVCREYWDRMGQEILTFLENIIDYRSCSKGSNYVVSILDDLFASRMQQRLGKAVQETDLEPPKTVFYPKFSGSILIEVGDPKKIN